MIILSSEKDEAIREQTRGLYLVGLLAVLVAFKLSTKLDPNADSVFTIVIMLWGAYSFCMVFAYSGIQNPIIKVSTSTNEQFMEFLKIFGQILLVTSLLSSIVFYVWFYWWQLIVALLVIIIAVVVYLPTWAIWKRQKKRKETLEMKE